MEDKKSDEEIAKEELQKEENGEQNLGESESKESEKSEPSKEELEEKIKECEDRYLRVHADFENVKKRLEKEKYQLLDYAYEKFAKDLLPVIDSLEMALQSTNNQEIESKELLEKVKEGIGLTLENFSKTFTKHGVEPIGVEDGFDPHFHDAVMQIDSPDHNSGEIVALLQKGYKYKERVLRPAMVSLCKK